MYARIAMIKIYQIFILIFLQACLPFQKHEITSIEKEMQIYHEWLFAFKLEDLKVSNNVIARPPGVEQFLFRLVIPNDGGVKLKTHCVYYRVPYKEITGLLKIIELKNDSQCSEISAGHVWLEFSELSELSVNLEKFKLNLSFKFKGERINWNFLLPNLDVGLVHEKYQAAKEKKLFPGLTLLRISDESFDIERNKYLGKLNDRLSLGSAIRCLQVDKNCQSIGENRCESCAYGWYQVVDYNCPQGGSKFCGQNHCGEKNEPACPRGIKVNGGEDTGICQSDLSPVLSTDHILVCQ